MLVLSVATVLPLTAQALDSVISPRLREAARGGIPRASAHYDSRGRLQLDVTYDCAMASPAALLASAGMSIGTSIHLPPLCVIEGWAPPSSLAAIEAIAGIKTIDLPKYPHRHPPLAAPALGTIQQSALSSVSSSSPAINGNGTSIMHTATFIQQTGVNGTGITVGIISDDVTSLSVIQGRGELPASVQVIEPSANPTHHTTLTDEGTMMLEEVYAAAPGAGLAFCGPASSVEYFACLQNLIAAGATIVDDDLAFFEDDVMSSPADDTQAAAIESVLTMNPTASLYHSVGNDAEDYWQGSYQPVAMTKTCTSGGSTQSDQYLQEFGTNSYLLWHTDGGNTLYLASALPTGQTTANHFDLYLVADNGGTPGAIVTCSTATSSGDVVGATSYTTIDGTSIPAGSYFVEVGTTSNSLTGTSLKLIGTDDGGGSFSAVTTGSPSSFQSWATGVITVGAVNGSNGVGNTIESFSDTGPIVYELPSPGSIQAPLLVAPDAIVVDASGTDFSSRAPSGIFSGTSAASPNAAVVCALLRSAFPTLTPAQIATYLETGATALGGTPPNATYGYGRVDAVGALSAIPTPTLTGLTGTSIVGGTSSSALPFTVGGIGAIKLSVVPASTLIPNSAGGVAIYPSTCGNPTTACTLTLTPASGQTGSTTVEVTATDGANRSQSKQISVTVTTPPAPTVAITAGATQTVAVNSPIAAISLTLTGTAPLAVTGSYTGSNTVVLSTGCGTTSLTCTATLGNATATGNGMVSFTVKDSYGQSASASTAITVGAPVAPTLTITSGANQSVPFDGTFGAIDFTLTGSAPLTVTPTLVGTATLSLSAGCGTTTMTCVIALNGGTGSPGTATLTLAVANSYGQTTSQSTSVTVQKPAAPTIAITAESSQSVTLNDAIAPVSFTLTGTSPLTVTTSSTSLSPVSISSGCGTTTLVCTAQLGTAGATAETATVTFTVTDSFGQSAGTTATVTEVAAPKKSGGGSLDWWAIIGLGSAAGAGIKKRAERDRVPVPFAART